MLGFFEKAFLTHAVHAFVDAGVKSFAVVIVQNDVQRFERGRKGAGQFVVLADGVACQFIDLKCTNQAAAIGRGKLCRPVRVNG